MPATSARPDAAKARALASGNKIARRLTRTRTEMTIKCAWTIVRIVRKAYRATPVINTANANTLTLSETSVFDRFAIQELRWARRVARQLVAKHLAEDVVPQPVAAPARAVVRALQDVVIAVAELAV